MDNKKVKRKIELKLNKTSILKEIGVEKDVHGIRKTEFTRKIISLAKKILIDAEEIPYTTYTRYREFQRIGERRGYETPYFLKRKKLTAAVICAFFTKEDKYLDIVNDYLIDICEETTWVLPAHEFLKIDLCAAETGLMLAETILLLNNRLPDEVIKRVKEEINKRIFIPYLKYHNEFFWFRGPRASNWNGVCNSSIGATFLHLEENKKRLSRAIRMVLKALKIFINSAFEKDGGSTEGVGYWQYGLINYVVFAELLRKRTRGKIDLLSSDRMKAVVSYPINMMLSPGLFANFADCSDKVSFHRGIITKLAERTKTPELLFLLSNNNISYNLLSLPIVLRDIFWCNGSSKPKKRDFYIVNKNAYLPSTQVVKLVSKTLSGKVVILVVKAGHNLENHNHNDIGSFIIHVNGETFLSDPGGGLYSKSYFSPLRYKNIFANSFGHNLPVIDGHLQQAGKKFRGKIIAYEPNMKRVTIEFGKAYGLSNLKSIRRILYFQEETNDVVLKDIFKFKKPMKIQEAFVTWLPVKCVGKKAYIIGKKDKLELIVDEPAGVKFFVKKLEKECKENAKTGLLRRIYFNIPSRSKEVCVSIKMKII